MEDTVERFIAATRDALTKLLMVEFVADMVQRKIGMNAAMRDAPT